MHLNSLTPQLRIDATGQLSTGVTELKNMIVVAGDPTVDWMMTRAESSVAVTYSYDVSSSVAVTA